MKRHLLIIDTTQQSFRLRSLSVETLEKDPRQEYLVLSGEALCQYLLRENREAMILARDPMPFLSGNKITTGYLSPLTGLPHYSFVGGRAARELLNLGLDAIVRVKQFSMIPMTQDEAIEQMELLGHDFFVFFNSEVEGINVLYRRKDGDYGLLQPELK